MIAIPKLVAKFWATLNNPTAPHGKVDMFHLDDEGGDTVFSLGVSFIEGHDVERAKATAAEFVRRSNALPDLLVAARVAQEILQKRLPGLDQNPGGVLDLLGHAIAQADGTKVMAGDKCANSHCGKAAEYECNTGGCDVVRLCQRHAESYFPGVRLWMHKRIAL